MSTTSRILAVLALAASGLFGIVPAHAEALDQTCTGSDTTSFDPPVTSTPKPTTVVLETTYALCLPRDQAGPRSGTSATTLEHLRSCRDLLQTGPITRTITWSTGETSVISGTATVTLAGPTLVTHVTGTVDEGLYEGDRFVAVKMAPSAGVLLCTLNQATVESLAGTATLEIT